MCQGSGETWYIPAQAKIAQAREEMERSRAEVERMKADDGVKVCDLLVSFGVGVRTMNITL